MLTPTEAEALGRRLAGLKCSDPKSGDGLFTYVLRGEPQNDASRYDQHVSECEYCRLALEIYRYKKHAAQLLGKD
jgi:hypothetical protein